MSETKSERPSVLSSLPKSFCEFKASLVPFLMSAGRDPFGRCQGISVLPHPSGGVVLAATSGPVLCAAYDPSGQVNEEGMSLIIPPDAVEACKPPKPMEFPDQGDVLEVPMPDWMQPDRVFAIGASLLIWPKQQPEDPGRREQDGVPIWSGMIETGNVHREDDYRRAEPWKWQRTLKAIDEGNSGRTVYVGTDALGLVTDAMRASSVNFWSQLQMAEGASYFVPARSLEEESAPPIAILFCHANPRVFEPAVDIPDWLSVLRVKETNEGTAQEPSNG